MPRGTGKRFDGNAWYEQYMTARTTAALEEKEKEFARAHAGVPERALIEYVRRCADEMGYTPAEKEVIGGSYIARRFGGWPAVLKEAQLVADHRCLPLTKRYIFRREWEIQAALHRQERDEKLREKELKKQKAKPETGDDC